MNQHLKSFMDVAERLVELGVTPDQTMDVMFAAYEYGEAELTLQGKYVRVDYCSAQWRSRVAGYRLVEGEV